MEETAVMILREDIVRMGSMEGKGRGVLMEEEEEEEELVLWIWGVRMRR